MAKTRRYDADAALRARAALKKFMDAECDGKTNKLGDALGVDQSTVWRALNDTPPSLDLLIRLRARTGATLDKLLGLDDVGGAAPSVPLTLSEERIAAAVVDKLRSVDEGRDVIAKHRKANAEANERVKQARADRKTIRAAQDERAEKKRAPHVEHEKKRDTG